MQVENVTYTQQCNGKLRLYGMGGGVDVGVEAVGVAH